MNHENISQWIMKTYVNWTVTIIVHHSAQKTQVNKTIAWKTMKMLVNSITWSNHKNLSQLNDSTRTTKTLSCLILKWSIKIHVDAHIISSMKEEFTRKNKCMCIINPKIRVFTNSRYRGQNTESLRNRGWHFLFTLTWY